MRPTYTVRPHPASAMSESGANRAGRSRQIVSMRRQSAAGPAKKSAIHGGQSFKQTANHDGLGRKWRGATLALALFGLCVHHN